MQIPFPSHFEAESGNEKQKDAVLLARKYEELHQHYYGIRRTILPRKNPTQGKMFPRLLTFIDFLYQEGIQQVGHYVEGVFDEFHHRHPSRYCHINVVLSPGGVKLYQLFLARVSSFTEISSVQIEDVDKYLDSVYNKIAPQAQANEYLRGWLAKRAGGKTE